MSDDSAILYWFKNYTFYRARYSYSKSSVRPSVVRLSVTLRYRWGTVAM